MLHRPIKTPGPEHPITTHTTTARILVSVDGHKIAETRDALVMTEAMYPRVLYISRNDVAMDMLERSSHSTYCPFKGDCSYYSIPVAGERGINAVWTYEAPFEWMADIAGRLAFYADRVDILETTD